MIRIDIHETIGQPVEAVFDWLADIEGHREWRPGAGGTGAMARISESRHTST